MVERKKIVIGTRGSKLALWQANYVAGLIKKHFSGSVELKVIKTKGDKILDSPLAKIGDKGLFVKEIELAILAGEVDLAVHSMKDLPTDIPQGLIIGGSTKREDPRDAFISNKFSSFAELPWGAKVATSSLRRKAQLLNRRGDLEFVEVRGNVDTRLRKLKEGQFDALVMALAGVSRLGYQDKVKEVLPTSVSLPAVGQGSIAIEAKENDKEILDLIAKISDPNSLIEITAERALMKRLEGGCQVPIGALAVASAGSLELEAMVASLDGQKVVRAKAKSSLELPSELGVKLAEELLQKGADKILEGIR